MGSSYDYSRPREKHNQHKTDSGTDDQLVRFRVVGRPWRRPRYRYRQPSRWVHLAQAEQDIEAVNDEPVVCCQWGLAYESGFWSRHVVGGRWMGCSVVYCPDYVACVSPGTNLFPPWAGYIQMQVNNLPDRYLGEPA